MKLVPGRADAYYRRGTDYDNLGDLNRGMQDYDRTIALNREYAMAYV